MYTTIGFQEETSNGFPLLSRSIRLYALIFEDLIRNSVTEIWNWSRICAGSTASGYWIPKDSPCLSFVKLICSGQMQRKILIFLCVVTWIVIIFVWRTLFWTRTYDTTNMQVLFTCYRLAYKRWLTSIDWNWFERARIPCNPTQWWR